MSNRLFNKELKMAYIENFFGEENTKNTLLYEFLKSSEIEKQYNKDLYAFNDEEISNLLLFLKRDNMSSLNKSVSVYKDYINWCILNGKRREYENGENRVAVFQKTEDISKYISNRKVRNKYLTKEELRDLVNYLNNPIDQAFVMCLYEFIAGERLHELRNLTIKDVEEAERNGNIIKLIDLDGKERFSTVSHQLIDLLKDVNKQEEYYKNNGMPMDNNIKPTQRLAMSDYIFRMGYRKSTIGKIASYPALNGKMQNIREYTGYNFITPSSLRETRIMHEISDVIATLKLNEVNDTVYDIAVNNINSLYNIQLSYIQTYNIKQKYEQAIKLKDFN